jgi:hypothetical protein
MRPTRRNTIARLRRVSPQVNQARDAAASQLFGIARLPSAFFLVCNDRQISIGAIRTDSTLHSVRTDEAFCQKSRVAADLIQ